jgi:hypothetical protein
MHDGNSAIHFQCWPLEQNTFPSGNFNFPRRYLRFKKKFIIICIQIKPKGKSIEQTLKQEIRLDYESLRFLN